MLNPLKDEQSYMLRISKSDEKAFAELFEYYRDRIYAFVLKLTRSTLVSEEIVEDVFLNIWLYRARLVKIENVESYLYTIAKNESYKVLKQIAVNYNTILLTEQHEVCSNHNCEDLLVGKEFNSILQKAVAQLPKQQKHVYQLMKVASLNRTEVATLLKLKPETVKFHLAQAMKSIRTFCMMHLHIFFGFIIIFSDTFLPISK
jgi:RNA polymerase sigma-70 factor (ECF subfamily)